MVKKNILKISLLIIIIIISSGSILTLITLCRNIYDKPVQQELWHKNVTELFNYIKPGDTKEDIIKLIDNQSWPKELIYFSNSQIRLRTPFEFPATNWIIILDFKENKLVWGRVRTESQGFNDEEKYKPVDAPKDIYFPTKDR